MIPYVKYKTGTINRGTYSWKNVYRKTRVINTKFSILVTSGGWERNNGMHIRQGTQAVLKVL